MAERIPLDLQKVRGHLARVREEIAPAAPQIVLVSKYLSPEDARRLVAEDLGPLGENRADDLCSKADEREPGTGSGNWHFIGHLQRNKASRVIPRVSLLHSLESRRLAATIERIAVGRGVPVACLVQVNTSGEEAKGGLEPAVADAEIVEWSRDFPHVHLHGLMTMAPLAPAESCRPVFRRLRELRDRVRDALDPDAAERFSELSMGMSNDYVVAAEEGATILRLGRCLLQ